MILPNKRDFKLLAKKGNLVAVQKQIPADLETPVSAFLKLGEQEDHAFLLESAEQGETIGRYSIIGLKPKRIFQGIGNSSTELTLSGKIKKKFSLPIVDLLKKHMSSYQLANPEALWGFAGGCVGFLSYENVTYFEDIKLKRQKKLPIPESLFFLSEELVIFDHYRKLISIAILAETKNSKDREKLYETTVKKIRGIVKKLQAPLKAPTQRKSKAKLSIQSNMTAKQFQDKVKKVKDYIRAGDCIQTVLSQRFTIKGSTDHFQIYRALRSINPSPYMFYFKSRKFKLIGSSPELLVKKTGKIAEVRPIAGTRPRGKTTKQDNAFAESLKRSKKEMAEHLMLVDLGRNDLGRVCRFESIQVSDFARIENYSHVMHLVSDVKGTLKPKLTGFDLLKATFPAGTVSGAPKIRAMEIINELETEERGPYAGSLGYFGFNQDMDMCILIRTLVLNGNTIYLQAGAGIVKDSNPKKEYEETHNKAKALLRALETQGIF